MSLDTAAPAQLPRSHEAEQAVLGTLLFDNDAFARLPEGFKAEFFYEPFHARLFAAMSERVRAGQMAEPIVLKERFAGDADFLELGGLRYLADLVDHAPPSTNVAAHADLVADRAARRSIYRLVSETGEHVLHANDRPATAILTELEQGAASIAREGASRPTGVLAGATAGENLERSWNGEFRGMPVGITALDNLTGGIKETDVWFLAGRVSMGKSVVGTNLIRGLAQQSCGCMMFSLEMPLREVQMRLIADLAFQGDARDNPSYDELLKGKFKTWGGRDLQELRERCRKAVKDLQDLPVVVDDTGGLTIDDISSRALRQVREWRRAGIEPGAILIDHIGLVQPSRRTDNKAADTSDIVNELKPLAKRLKTPVIALAQVNRNTENRTDKKPTLGDLNWSGAIEQIADFVCLLYRESYYLARSSDREDQALAQAKATELELLVRKNRSGRIGDFKAEIHLAANAVRDVPGDVREF